MVVGEEPVGFDDFAPLARQIEFGGDQHLVHAFAQGRDRLFQPLQLLHRTIGDHLVNAHARLVQNQMADRNAFRQALTGEFARPVDTQFRLVQFGDVEEAALGHDFRQHHRDGLQRLDFFFGVDAFGLVLHRENAEDLTAAHDRHAQKGFVGILAGFRTIREMRVGRRVGQIHRFSGFRHHADQALAFAHPRIMDGGAVEAFGGEQFQHLAGTAQIDGTDFRHHVGSDDADQFVQAHLGGGLLRHDLAQATQQ